MSASKRVLSLVVTAVIVYTALSLLSFFIPLGIIAFDKINLLADLLKVEARREVPVVKKLSVVETHVEKSDSGRIDFDRYKMANLITDFKTHAGPSLESLMVKLSELKKGKKRKVRIAYIGDSMIEGDQISGTLRDSLQAAYGGAGVGFLTIHTNVGNFRHSATIKAAGWNDTNFKSPASKNLYLSGHYFTGHGRGTYSDKSIRQQTRPMLEKSLLFGVNANHTIGVDGRNILLRGQNLVNRQVLSIDTSTVLQLENTGGELLYGVSFESESGVIVDNFSFRGISGSEFRKLDPEFMEAIQQANHYDLIILHYGANLIYKPSDANFEFYMHAVMPVFKRFRSSFPDSDFLLISAGDIAFRYNGNYSTAIGLPKLLETQAQLALRNKFAFFNLFASMGGQGSIISWANHHPAWAIKDYVHPTEDGSQVIGAMLYKAIQHEYKKLPIQ